jgi:hypothetical protein
LVQPLSEHCRLPPFTAQPEAAAFMQVAAKWQLPGSVSSFALRKKRGFCGAKRAIEQYSACHCAGAYGWAVNKEINSTWHAPANSVFGLKTFIALTVQPIQAHDCRRYSPDC